MHKHRYKLIRKLTEHNGTEWYFFFCTRCSPDEQRLTSYLIPLRQFWSKP